MKVIVPLAAKLRLAATIRFYKEVYSPEYASRVLDAIDEAILWLGDHPYGGPLEPLVKGKHAYRKWIVGYVKIIYFVGRNRLVITDIFDARQDPRKMKG